MSKKPWLFPIWKVWSRQRLGWTNRSWLENRQYDILKRIFFRWFADCLKHCVPGAKNHHILYVNIAAPHRRFQRNIVSQNLKFVIVKSITVSCHSLNEKIISLISPIIVLSSAMLVIPSIFHVNSVTTSMNCQNNGHQYPLTAGWKVWARGSCKLYLPDLIQSHSPGRLGPSRNKAALLGWPTASFAKLPRVPLTGITSGSFVPCVKAGVRVEWNRWGTRSWWLAEQIFGCVG